MRFGVRGLDEQMILAEHFAKLAPVLWRTRRLGCTECGLEYLPKQAIADDTLRAVHTRFRGKISIRMQILIKRVATHTLRRVTT